MILFHYTNILALGGILNTGTLKTSKVMPGLLCLTDDVEPVGHGLPDGREINAQRSMLMGGYKSGKGYRCYDFTEFRIVINFDPNDPKLVKAPAVFTKGQLQSLAITAYHPTDPKISRRTFKSTREDFKRGKLVAKSSTWWFYRDSITTDRFSGIQMRLASGHYVDVPAVDPLPPTR